MLKVDIIRVSPYLHFFQVPLYVFLEEPNYLLLKQAFMSCNIPLKVEEDPNLALLLI